MKICEFKRKGELIAKLHANIGESYVELVLAFNDGMVQTEYYSTFQNKKIEDCFLFCVYSLIERNNGYPQGVMMGTPLKAIDRLGKTLKADVFFEKGDTDKILLSLV